MTEPKIDPGHLWSPAEWRRVQSDAVEYARLHGQGGKPATIAHIYAQASRSSFPSIDGLVQAKYDGGARPGQPTFAVLHSAETPLANGYALSIANMFTRNTNSTSAHFMLGPDAGYQLLDTSRIGWHVGNGNPRSIGVEQAGYASFSRAQWMTADGMKQIARLAQLMREIEKVHKIGLHFMSDTELLAAHRGQVIGGWATHDQCRRVLGGTTHTDPMPNYPVDVLLAQAITPAPNPTPTTSTQEHEMFTAAPSTTDVDFVIPVRPSDTKLKLVGVGGSTHINQINGMKPDAKGTIGGVGVVTPDKAFDLPLFHGPVWDIPAGCTCVVVSHRGSGFSGVVY